VKAVGSAELNSLMSEIASEDATNKSASEEKSADNDKDKANEAALVRLVNAIIEKAERHGRERHPHRAPHGGAGGGPRPHRRLLHQRSGTPEIPNGNGRAMVARIKIMANLDIAERRFPQDGKIPFKKFGARDIELRVADDPDDGRPGGRGPPHPRGLEADPDREARDGVGQPRQVQDDRRAALRHLPLRRPHGLRQDDHAPLGAGLPQQAGREDLDRGGPRSKSPRTACAR
jgi:hypothetical protein